MILAVIPLILGIFHGKHVSLVFGRLWNFEDYIVKLKVIENILEHVLLQFFVSLEVSLLEGWLGHKGEAKKTLVFLIVFHLSYSWAILCDTHICEMS